MHSWLITAFILSFASLDSCVSMHAQHQTRSRFVKESFPGVNKGEFAQFGIVPWLRCPPLFCSSTNTYPPPSKRPSEANIYLCPKQLITEVGLVFIQSANLTLVCSSAARLCFVSSVSPFPIDNEIHSYLHLTSLILFLDRQLRGMIQRNH